MKEAKRRKARHPGGFTPLARWWNDPVRIRKWRDAPFFILPGEIGVIEGFRIIESEVA